MEHKDQKKLIKNNTMKAIIETRFDVGQEVYLPTYGLNGKVLFGKVHRITVEWSPYGGGVYYDVCVGDELSKGIPESAVTLTREEAEEFMK